MPSKYQNKQAHKKLRNALPASMAPTHQWDDNLTSGEKMQKTIDWMTNNNVGSFSHLFVSDTLDEATQLAFINKFKPDQVFVSNPAPEQLRLPLDNG